MQCLEAKSLTASSVDLVRTRVLSDKLAPSVWKLKNKTFTDRSSTERDASFCIFPDLSFSRVRATNIVTTRSCPKRRRGSLFATRWTPFRHKLKTQCAGWCWRRLPEVLNVPKVFYLQSWRSWYSVPYRRLWTLQTLQADLLIRALSDLDLSFRCLHWYSLDNESLWPTELCSTINSDNL